MQKEIKLSDLMSLHGEKFIRKAYLSVLHRDADEAGLRTYLNRLSIGYGKKSILHDLLHSREAQAVQDPLSQHDISNEEFVSLAYRSVLFREADTGGFLHYLSILEKGGNRNEVIKDIMSSEEASNIKRANKTLTDEIIMSFKNEKMINKIFSFFNFGRCIDRSIGRVEWELGAVAAEVSRLSNVIDDMNRLIGNTRSKSFDVNSNNEKPSEVSQRFLNGCNVEQCSPLETHFRIYTE
jgi:hypothetical protein